MQLIDSENERFLCPRCGESWVHLDDVYVAGRAREDGDIEPVHVNSAGYVRRGVEVALPSTDFGRRHTFTITGYCETCGTHFGVEFQQHKGQTLIKVLQKDWRPLRT